MNIALRAPFDLEALERFSAALQLSDRQLVTTAHVVRAPGRVNLIGDHTDYTGGLVLPMAIDRWTEIRFTARRPRRARRPPTSPSRSTCRCIVDDPGRRRARLGPSTSPAWWPSCGPSRGIHGHVTTDIPIGAGLSSSAALEVAVALALGVTDAHRSSWPQLCRRAENRASGVPSGIMDQLASPPSWPATRCSSTAAR